MSVMDKIAAAVTPPESETARRGARENALQAEVLGDWLALILEHHQKIETAFVMVKKATTAPGRRAAQKKLATLLNDHSPAEETVLYPSLSVACEMAALPVVDLRIVPNDDHPAVRIFERVAR